MQLVIRLIINAVAIWLAAAWVDKIDIISPEDETSSKVIVVLAVAAVFTLVNALVKPLVKLLSLPLVVLTLGLFLLVVNAPVRTGKNGMELIPALRDSGLALLVWSALTALALGFA